MTKCFRCLGDIKFLHEGHFHLKVVCASAQEKNENVGFLQGHSIVHLHLQACLVFASETKHAIAYARWVAMKATWNPHHGPALQNFHLVE